MNYGRPTQKQSHGKNSGQREVSVLVNQQNLKLLFSNTRRYISEETFQKRNINTGDKNFSGDWIPTQTAKFIGQSNRLLFKTESTTTTDTTGQFANIVITVDTLMRILLQAGIPIVRCERD